MLHIKKKILVFIAIFSFIFLSIPIQALAANESMVKVGEEIITRGAILEQYNINYTSGTTKAYVLKIDLADPYIKIDTIYGTNNQLGKNQSIENMAKEKQAIAAINGDFFDMKTGSSLGPLVSDSIWLTTPTQIEGLNSFALTNEKEPIILPFTFSGEIKINNNTFSVTSINKTLSIIDKLNIYDNNWNFNNWAGDNLDSYVAIVVENEKIVEISENSKPQIEPENGYIALGHGIAAQFLEDNAAIGESIKLVYDINPENDWSTVVGGHTLLVKDGKRAEYTRDVTSIAGVNARTAIGYSKDKRYLYWIIAEKSNQSQGMTLEQLADFMINIDINQGLNLDGGGSTTLVGRHTGDFTTSLINIPKDGKQRNVPNGLGLFSLAPQGTLTDILIKTQPFLLKGEDYVPAVKGIDEYYNPVSLENQNITWSSQSKFIDVIENRLEGKKEGIEQISVKIGNVFKQFTLEVVGRDQIKSLGLGIPAIQKNDGNNPALRPVLTTKNDKSRVIPANLLNWEMIGIDGSVDEDGNVQLNTLNGTGWLVGSYDRFSSMIPVQTKRVDEVLTDFEDQTLKLKFIGLPATTTGEVKLTKVDNDKENYSAELIYDFSKPTKELKVAYLQIGEEGIKFSKNADSMTLWAHGDNSGHWLRAEIIDKNQQVHLITLADKVNWTGWKKLSVDFSQIIKEPKLKKIYMVNTEEGQENRLTKGKIYLDNIEFKTWEDLPKPKDVTLKLYIDKKYMMVDKEKKTIDQAPIILNGKSYIPARFITESLGGQVLWYGSEQKVRILLGETMIDLWINDKEHTIVNGINKPSDVSPIIKQNRTLIPVRMVTENLGYRVEWLNGEIIIYKK